jgi:hypothetical protein
MTRRLLVLGALILTTATAMAPRPAMSMVMAPTIEQCGVFCDGLDNIQEYNADGKCICKGAAT